MQETLSDEPAPEAWRLPGFSFEAMPGGARNRVLRGTVQGAGYVFKQTRRTEDQLRWLSHVDRAAQAVGLEVALPIPTASGTMRYRGWTMERAVDGRVATWNDLFALSERISAFHKAAASTPQRPGFATARDLIDTDRGGDIDLAAMPAALADQCRAAWSLLPSAPTTIIHADLTTENILVKGDGTPVLLDWDEARVDLAVFDDHSIGKASDPITHAAALAFEIAVCWCIEPERARRLAYDLPRALERATL